MDRFINVPLIVNPYNWVVILGVTFLLGLSLHLIFPATGSAKSQNED